MNPDLLILLASNVANLVIGGIVLLRNPRLLINRVFAFVSFAIIFWTTANYLADHTSLELTLIFSRLTFVGGVLILLAVLSLSRYLPDNKLLQDSKVNKIQVFVALIIALLSLSPWVIASATKGESGAILEVGPLYIIYIIYIFQGLLLLFRNMFLQLKNAKTGYQKDQLRLVAVGIFLYAIFAVTSNLLIPAIINDWTTSRYGPLFSLFLVGLTAFAIVRHKLFDVKLAIARSFAYLGALVTFAALYGFLIFGGLRIIFGVEIPALAQILISAVTGIAALSFIYFRRVFDRITNSLFYKDAYDAQEFFDVFNKDLVSSIDLRELLHSTSRTIADFLRTKYCLAAVNSSKRFVLAGTLPENVVSEKATAIMNTVTQTDQVVIVADELPSDQEELRNILYENNIAVLIRLGAEYSKKSEEGAGYIALGPKRNGGSYNASDIRVLETVANELVIAIQNSLRFEEIRNFNKTLQTKVDEATAKLRRTNAKLKQLDEAKDEFISMASHQLRTPLTSVKGYLSMVLEGDAGDLKPSQRKLLEEAYSGAQRMVYLIADFLNISRLKTGKFILEYSNVNLAHLINEEIGQLKAAAKGRQLTLQYEAPDSLPTARIDENKIRQVVMNLIDNAIYYSKPGGTIKVELFADNGHVIFRVKDNGIGVPASEQKNLFEKFFRASNARKVRPDGTGIGLFMIKKVILAHSGSIIFQSTPGKGSTFGFSLPLKAKPKMNQLEAESLQQSNK